MGNSLSPGNEQAEYWGTESANRPSSRNHGGVSDPAIDSLIRSVIEAPDRPSLVTAYHALDRALVWNHFRVLTYGRSGERIAHWAKLKHPEKWPLTGVSSGLSEIMLLWWNDPATTQVAASQTTATDADPEPPSERGWLIAVLIALGVGAAGFIYLRRRRSP